MLTKLSKNRYLGVFQQLYDDSFFSESCSTHYIVLVYEIKIKSSELTLLYQQHQRYRWFTEDEILESNCVHENTKLYFK